jgi:hypothetical protein
MNTAARRGVVQAAAEVVQAAAVVQAAEVVQTAAVGQATMIMMYSGRDGH